MNTLRQRLLSNWHLMRIVRLILSVGLLVMAFHGKDIAMGSLALLFLVTTIAGVGCCGPNGCSIPERTYYKGKMTDASDNKTLDVD